MTEMGLRGLKGSEFDFFSDPEYRAEVTRRFGVMLDEVLTESGYVPPEGRPAVVLNLACGESDEAEVLHNRFGGRVIGVDEDHEAIYTAMARYEGIEDIEFHVGDATDLTQLPQIPPKVDIILVRNQEMVAHPEIRAKILQQGLSRLSDTGRMIVTSRSAGENRMATTELRRLGGEVTDRVNPHALPLRRDEDVAPDKRVAVITKPQRQAA